MLILSTILAVDLTRVSVKVGDGISTEDCNYRAKLVTDADGAYWFTSIRPKFYPIPHDGPVGALLEKMNQHHFRPAHIHLVVTGSKAAAVVWAAGDAADWADDAWLLLLVCLLLRVAVFSCLGLN